MTCLPGTPICVPTPGSIVNDSLQYLAVKTVEAILPVVRQVGTMWVDTPTPQIAADASSGRGSAAVEFIQGSLLWYTAAAVVLAVLIGAGRMAWEQRAAPGRDLLQALVTFIVVSGAGLSVVALGTTAGDAFSQWVIDRSTEGGTFDQSVAHMLGFLAVPAMVAGQPGAPVMFVIVAGVLALVFSCCQIVLMVVRGGLLVVLAGVLPLTASLTNTETGRAWFRKTCGWLVAFMVYKPAAAIIYATAFQLVAHGPFTTDRGSSGGGGITSALTGVTLMGLALVALPALLRFVVPMTSAIAGTGGGGAALGAAAMALPSGAISHGASHAAAGGRAPSGSTRSAGGNSSVSTGNRGVAGAGAAGAGAGGAASGAAGAAGGPAGIAAQAGMKAAQTTKKAGATAAAAQADGPTGAPADTHPPNGSASSATGVRGGGSTTGSSGTPVGGPAGSQQDADGASGTASGGDAPAQKGTSATTGRGTGRAGARSTGGAGRSGAPRSGSGSTRTSGGSPTAGGAGGAGIPAPRSEPTRGAGAEPSGSSSQVRPGGWVPSPRGAAGTARQAHRIARDGTKGMTGTSADEQAGEAGPDGSSGR